MTNKQLKNLKDRFWTTADQHRAKSSLKFIEYAEHPLIIIEIYLNQILSDKDMMFGRIV